jgi:hypothetical protein
LSSHLHQCLASGLFPSGLTITFLYTPVHPHTCYMPCPSHSRFDHPNNMWWAAQIIKFPVMQFPPLPSHLVPLRPQYPPQHPVLEHPQPRFLPSSFMPAQNKRFIKLDTTDVCIKRMHCLWGWGEVRISQATVLLNISLMYCMLVNLFWVVPVCYISRVKTV